MKDFTKHAQRQNDELGVELDRLSLNYTLTNHEQETVRELGEQIKAIIKQYRDDAEAVANKTAVYSQVLDRQKSNQKNLTEIEKAKKNLTMKLLNYRLMSNAPVKCFKNIPPRFVQFIGK